MSYQRICANGKTMPAVSRRAFLTTAVVTAATPAVALIAPVDPHTEWVRQWRIARVDWCRAADVDPSGDSNTPECEEACAREYALLDLIVQTKAKTREGADAQVQLLLEYNREELTAEFGETFLASISGGLALGRMQ
ncbi:hypothetical protein [Parasedimentitalea psychrophila]|uniref:Uncharacterized protein n=1 Tax=Parasedimentitalea psychrophila TaxID=2997337 RepID=A0A9Y2L4V5_9RHOB|nr:hypothetical protein [Parasedimentitalea psychrophila]WIY26959.1 hypothetical protein QPJ95_08620 [Parasedimentitalea psychrophila]